MIKRRVIGSEGAIARQRKRNRDEKMVSKERGSTKMKKKYNMKKLDFCVDVQNCP